jgi:putative GTP pyrophosphokinase
MAIIDDFDQQEPLLQQLAEKLRILLHELTNTGNTRVNSVTARVKSRESLLHKLGKTEGKYQHLAQITDLCGARIITYFEDGVDAVAKLVEAEFEIDLSNSVDKRALRDVDRFGYTSVHYIARFNETRTRLSEYSRFQGMSFEVQIRSVLQHAWAEIEHDLQYKGEASLPREFTRRFARLAGLLEIADAEFIGIRDAIRGYPEPLPDPLNPALSPVPLNLDSMKALIEDSSTTIGVDKRLADAINVPVVGQMLESGFAFKVLNHLDVKTIGAVESALSSGADRIVGFANAWLNRPDPLQVPLDSLPRGISLYYLAFDLILQAQESVPEVAAILRAVGLRTGTEADEMAKELRDVYDASMPAGGIVKTPP